MHAKKQTLLAKARREENIYYKLVLDPLVLWLSLSHPHQAMFAIIAAWVGWLAGYSTWYIQQATSYIHISSCCLEEKKLNCPKLQRERNCTSYIHSLENQRQTDMLITLVILSNTVCSWVGVQCKLSYWTASLWDKHGFEEHSI